MPPKALTAVQSAISIALTWRRRFLFRSHFADADELLAAAFTGGDAQLYVDEILGLRHKPSNRHTVAELQHHYQRNVNYARRVKEVLWTRYSLDKQLCTRNFPRDEPDALQRLTKRQRRHLTAVGTHPVKKRRVSEVAQLHQAQALSFGAPLVVWADNFNVHKYRTNPNEDRTLSINGTVYAVFPLPSAAQLHYQWPTVRDLAAAIPRTAAYIHTAATSLGDDVRAFVARGLQYDDIRVPCDIKRRGVTAMQWWPFHVAPFNVGSTAGLGRAIDYAMSIGAPIGRVQPILLDVNVWYRLLKALYCTTNNRINLTVAMQHSPLLFGVWHTYAHAVRRTYSVFLPFWAALENPFLLQPNATEQQQRVYGHPKLLTLEHTVAALFLAAPRLASKLDVLYNTITATTPAGTLWRRVTAALRLFLTEYIPALMFLGYIVRQLYWTARSPGTGTQARDVLGHAAAYLLALEPSATTEYNRALTLALHFWDAVHNAIPAVWSVQEQ